MSSISFTFFFNDPATTEIYTLSLHDALPISAKALPPAPVISIALIERSSSALAQISARRSYMANVKALRACGDRKSTRLNSSHVEISYAVFCLKKKIYIHATYFNPGGPYQAC